MEPNDKKLWDLLENPIWFINGFQEVNLPNRILEYKQSWTCSADQSVSVAWVASTWRRVPIETSPFLFLRRCSLTRGVTPAHCVYLCVSVSCSPPVLYLRSSIFFNCLGTQKSGNHSAPWLCCLGYQLHDCPWPYLPRNPHPTGRKSTHVANPIILVTSKLLMPAV